MNDSPAGPAAPGVPPPAPAVTPAGDQVPPGTVKAASAEAEGEGPDAWSPPPPEPAAPAPLGVARVPTGRPDVDAVLERLADADHLATDGHIAVYEDVHRGLREALTALDARPGPPAPPSPYDHRS